MPQAADCETLAQLPGLRDGVLDLSTARDTAGSLMASHLSRPVLQALNQYVREVGGVHGITAIILPPMNDTAQVLPLLDCLPHLADLTLPPAPSDHKPDPDLQPRLDELLHRGVSVHEATRAARAMGLPHKDTGVEHALDPADDEGPVNGLSRMDHSDILAAFDKLMASSPDIRIHKARYIHNEELQDRYPIHRSLAHSHTYKSAKPWVSSLPSPASWCRDHPAERLSPEHLGAFWLMKNAPIRVLGQEAMFACVLLDARGCPCLAVETQGSNERLASMPNALQPADGKTPDVPATGTHRYVLPMASLPASEVHWLHRGQSAIDRALNSLRSTVALLLRADAPPNASTSDMVRRQFLCLNASEVDEAMLAILSALEPGVGAFDTAALSNEELRFRVHTAPARFWQALDEYAHAFNGQGLSVVNLTIAGLCPAGAASLAKLQTLYMPDVQEANMLNLLSDVPGRFRVVFDSVTNGGRVTVPDGFQVFTLEEDPPPATVVFTNPDGGVNRYERLLCDPQAPSA